MDINDIDSLLDYIERHHTIIEDRDEVLSFYHDYACRTCEYQGIDPHKATEYIHKLIIDRLRTTAVAARVNYEGYPLAYIKLNQLLEKVDMEKMVQREQGRSVPIADMDKHYDTLDDWLKGHDNCKK